MAVIVMNVQVWIRLLGLAIVFAVGGDVITTVMSVPHKWLRRRLAFVLSLIVFFNILMTFVVLLMPIICPVALNLLAASYYMSKVLTGYLYCLRVDLLLNGPLQHPWFKHITFVLKCYLFVVFLVNIGKAILVYSSSLENGTCIPYFGRGIWVYLDEIMFTLADLATFAMLLFFYVKHIRNSLFSTHNDAHAALRRILRLAFIPLCFTICTTIQIFLQPELAKYMGDFDMQIHMICIFVAYDRGGQKSRNSQGSSHPRNDSIKQSSKRISLSDDQDVGADQVAVV